MLILTRRIGETLIIDNNISITILGIKGNQIRIGINAPKKISIYRKEIYIKINSRNKKIYIKNNNNILKKKD